MIYCSSCGKQQSKGDKFCPNCGAPNSQFQGEERGEVVSTNEEMTGRPPVAAPIGHQGYQTYQTGGKMESDLNQITSGLLFLVILRGLSIIGSIFAYSLFAAISAQIEIETISPEFLIGNIVYSGIVVVGFTYYRQQLVRRSRTAFSNLQFLLILHILVSLASIFFTIPGGGILDIGLAGLVYLKLNNREFKMTYLEMGT